MLMLGIFQWSLFWILSSGHWCLLVPISRCLCPLGVAIPPLSTAILRNKRRQAAIKRYSSQFLVNPTTENAQINFKKGLQQETPDLWLFPSSETQELSPNCCEVEDNLRRFWRKMPRKYQRRQTITLEP